LTNNKRTKQI
jgi:hypothetical protein